MWFIEEAEEEEEEEQSCSCDDNDECVDEEDNNVKDDDVESDPVVEAEKKIPNDANCQNNMKIQFNNSTFKVFPNLFNTMFVSQQGNYLSGMFQTIVCKQF